jgi:hypothetical protein
VDVVFQKHGENSGQIHFVERRFVSVGLIVLPQFDLLDECGVDDLYLVFAKQFQGGFEEGLILGLRRLRRLRQRAHLFSPLGVADFRVGLIAEGRIQQRNRRLGNGFRGLFEGDGRTRL